MGRSDDQTRETREGAGERGGFAGFFDALPEVARLVAVVFFVGVLASVVIAAPIVEDNWYREAFYAERMALFFGIALALVLAGALVVSRFARRPDNGDGSPVRNTDNGDGSPVRSDRARSKQTGEPSPLSAFAVRALICVAVLFAVQVLIVRYAFFVTDWDVGHVTFRYEGGGTLPEYLSLYPFQAFFLGILKLAGGLFGPPGSNPYYLGCVGAGVLSADVAIYLMGITAERLFGRRWAWLSLALGIWFCGLSPWILVPYTDVFAMPFPVAIVCCYACWLPRSERKPLVWGVMAFLGVVGYAIKPTVVFALCACVAVSLCRAIARALAGRREGADASKPSLARGAWTLGACAVGAALAWGLFSAVGAWGAAGIAYDPSRAFGIPHYLMMGATSGGGYTKEDVALSTSIADPAARTATNLEVWRERLAEMGPVGVQQLALRKALTTFASGSFTWGQEGEFFSAFPDGGMNLLHAFYGMPLREAIDAGELDAETSYQGRPTYEAPYFAISQVLWLAVLVCLALEVADREPSDPLRAIFAALFALGVFLLVFECRARYLILYLPCFMLAATSGFRALCTLLAGRREDAGAPEGER